jgi:hypothetical protein
MQKQIQQLLQKEMTRREFITTLGFGLASVAGLSTVVKLVSGRTSLGKAQHGYGSSAYGGKD